MGETQSRSPNAEALNATRAGSPAPLPDRPRCPIRPTSRAGQDKRPHVKESRPCRSPRRPRPGKRPGSPFPCTRTYTRTRFGSSTARPGQRTRSRSPHLIRIVHAVLSANPSRAGQGFAPAPVRIWSAVPLDAGQGPGQRTPSGYPAPGSDRPRRPIRESVQGRAGQGFAPARSPRRPDTGKTSALT